MRDRHRHNGKPRLYGAPPIDAHPRCCDWPGCDDGGEFRAPRSPRELDVYLWFCKDHIRQYNASWNFYAGMAEEEVEADIRRDTVWRRPTWPLGGRPTAGGFRITDGFAYFDQEAGPAAPPPRQPPTAEELALEVLELEAPVTTAMVKARYKELVKRHHPDANGGTKASEEKFKEIDRAYRTIIDSLAT